MFNLNLCFIQNFHFIFLFQVALQQNFLMHTNNYGQIDRQILRKNLNTLKYINKNKKLNVYLKRNRLYKHNKVNFVAK